MYLQRNINEYEISKLTTKKGRITIPLFKMMAFVETKIFFLNLRDLSEWILQPTPFDLQWNFSLTFLQEV